MEKNVINIILWEQLTDSNEIEKFLKYNGVKISVISDKQSRVNTIIEVRAKIFKYKQVVELRMNGSLPAILNSYHMIIFPVERYEQGKTIALNNHKLRVFILNQGNQLEFESTSNFRVTQWQYISEYVRECLKVKKKPEGLKKSEPEKPSQPPEEENMKDEHNEYYRPDDDVPF